MFLDTYVDHCHKNLLQNSSMLPLSYLVSRGLELSDIKKYKIGYMGNFYKNPNPDEHDEAPSFNKWLGYNGKFIRNRIVFPIYDEIGHIRGIETRALDKRSTSVLLPKFKIKLKDIIEKLPESEVRYKKFYLEKNKYISTYFGLPESLPFIWEKREIFLTEGIFDMIVLSKIKKNCLSPLTANINANQISWLKRYVNKIILIFDMDEKGKKAVKNLKDQLEGQIEVFSIPLKGKDVNDFVIHHGLKDLEIYLNDKLENIF